MTTIKFKPDFVYPRIEIPLNKPFEKTNKLEAKIYLNWFLNNIKNRMKILEYFVLNERENWNPDYSIDSLDLLGSWLLNTSRLRHVTSVETENQIIQKQYPQWFVDFIREINTTLSIETISRCFDTGIYLGEVLRKNVPELTWTFRSTPKSFIDFHQPILVNQFTKKATMNPIRVVEVITFKMLEGKEGSDGLKNTFKIWADIFRS